MQKTQFTALFFIFLFSSCCLAEPLKKSKPAAVKVKEISRETIPETGETIIKELYRAENKMDFSFESVRDTGNANEYMDQLLLYLREAMDQLGLDVIYLPDESYGFDFTIFWFIHIYANANFTNGVLKGLDTIHRTGDATAVEQGEDWTLDCDVGINNAVIGYDFQVDAEGIDFPLVSIDGTIDTISAHITILYHAANQTATVQEFHVTSIGLISVDVGGLSIFDFLAEIVADFIINLVKIFIPLFIDDDLANLLQQILDYLLPGNTGSTVNVVTSDITVTHKDVYPHLKLLSQQLGERTKSFKFQ